MILFVCVLKMIYTVQSNCLHSSVNFQFLVMVRCYNTVWLSSYVKFESVLKENGLKI